jgi:hypothetical protein
MRSLSSFLALIALLTSSWQVAEATIIVNPAATINRELVVQLIQARENDGSNPATVLGNAAQRLSIEMALDQIWAQAGIDITLLPTVTPFNNSFALDKNNNTAGTRPISDFDLIFVQASAAGVLNNSNVINVIFVDYVPGFPIVSENSSAGLAAVPGNQITMFAGDNLFGFQNGLDVIASVFAHEIGHNLGLDHAANGGDNLMSPSGTSERLNASQINTARSSSLLRVIPEPGAAFIAAAGLLLVINRRR